jgi:hypothetical protein
MAARTEAFFQIWTLNEAYLKGSGRGVGVDLYAHALAAPAGYRAALAIPLRAPNVLIESLVPPLRDGVEPGWPDNQGRAATFARPRSSDTTATSTVMPR